MSIAALLWLFDFSLAGVQLLLRGLAALLAVEVCIVRVHQPLLACPILAASIKTLYDEQRFEGGRAGTAERHTSLRWAGAVGGHAGHGRDQ